MRFWARIRDYSLIPCKVKGYVLQPCIPQTVVHEPSGLWSDKNGKWKEVFRNFYSNLTLLQHFIVFYKIIGSGGKHRSFSTEYVTSTALTCVSPSLWPLIISEVTLAHWPLTLVLFPIISTQALPSPCYPCSVCLWGSSGDLSYLL